MCDDGSRARQAGPARWRPAAIRATTGCAGQDRAQGAVPNRWTCRASLLAQRAREIRQAAASLQRLDASSNSCPGGSGGRAASARQQGQRGRPVPNRQIKIVAQPAAASAAGAASPSRRQGERRHGVAGTGTGRRQRPRPFAAAPAGQRLAQPVRRPLLPGDPAPWRCGSARSCARRSSPGGSPRPRRGKRCCASFRGSSSAPGPIPTATPSW